jgi:hypothetical protein
MGAALEVITGAQVQATTTAGTYTAFTANSGQSFAIRQANGTPAGTVMGPWASFGAAGKLQIKTPRWHDTTIGDTYHVQITTGTLAVQPLLDLWDGEPAYSTDTLTVQMTTDTSQASSTNYALGLPVYYPNLPGVDANFITAAQLQSYDNPLNKTGLHYVNYVSASSAATAGQIGTGVLINSTNDQYKAGHTYARISPVHHRARLGDGHGQPLCGWPGVARPEGHAYVVLAVGHGQQPAPDPMHTGQQQGHHQRVHLRWRHHVNGLHRLAHLLGPGGRPGRSGRIGGLSLAGNMRRVLCPWGVGRAFPVAPNGLLISGSGCITYADAFETTGSATASVTLYDGNNNNGQVMIDYQLSAGQSTSEQWGPHWMPFYQGLFLVTNSGAASGSISVWADHDCAYHLNTTFLAIEGSLVSQALANAPIVMAG